MSVKLLLDLLACVGHLGVAVLVLWRPGSNPLALLVGLLSLDLFAWNFAGFAYVMSGRPEWHWLDLSLSPFSGARQLHVVLAFVVAGLTLGLALFAVGRRLFVAWRAERPQLQAMATLGRLSAQMAHDLRNPLAAIKGGVQFLREEVAQGRPLVAQGNLLDLVSQQVERVEQVVTGHQRLGRIEPQRRPIDLNALVREVLAVQPFANANVTVHMHLDGRLPAWSADRDLLACALENLVRNAAEAMPEGGTLVVRTAGQGRSTLKSALITVEDSGCGMDARAAERAFDDFFTTSPSNPTFPSSCSPPTAPCHSPSRRFGPEPPTSCSSPLIARRSSSCFARCWPRAGRMARPCPIAPAMDAWSEARRPCAR